MDGNRKQGPFHYPLSEQKISEEMTPKALEDTRQSTQSSGARRISFLDLQSTGVVAAAAAAATAAGSSSSPTNKSLPRGIIFYCYQKMTHNLTEHALSLEEMKQFILQEEIKCKEMISRESNDSSLIS
ncbi:unnamed protein product, partial [Allacma fusca]